MTQVPSLRLLVVDDDPQMLASLERGLSTLGARVDAFEDTNRALLQLEPGRYEAVISDQVLDGALCGHEFLLAASQVDPTACTILMSGQDLAARTDLPFERYGAVVAKPVTPFELLELIEELRSGERERTAA